MKFHKMPTAEVRPNDTLEMRQAIKLLKKRGVDARRPVESDYQLKLDPRTSYYPGKGTLFVDREQGARPERGLSALEAWIAEVSETCSRENYCSEVEPSSVNIHLSLDE